METTDVEKLVGELEIAVDRLRSLYEQYFMGIEKIEPSVPRKDVDRRIHVLRKEQIRNTAQRFRFQMVLQRYNTYQTHWQRICREIENGTYKRHVIRARQRLGDGPVSSRRRSTSPPPPPQPVRGPLPESLAAELAELDLEFAPAAQVRAAGPISPQAVRTIAVAKAVPVPAPAAASGAPKAANPAGPPPQAPRMPPPLPGRTGAAPVPGRAPAPSPPLRSPGLPEPPPAPTPGAARVPPGPAPQVPARPVATAPAALGRPAPPGAAVAPPAPRPAAAAAPPRPVPPKEAPRPVAAAKDELADDRVRQLYAQYVETKRQHNESTAAITYEAVARSLRDATVKLKERHGKSIDFEVTVKDGKTILKPVLK